jgi:hypothetical protein
MTSKIWIGVVILVIGLTSEVGGQNAPSAGFFSIVNAVGLSSNTIVSVDGRALRADGLKQGKVTGGLGFPVGTHQIEARNAECTPAAAPLQVVEGVSPIVVVYTVLTNHPGGAATRDLKLFTRGNSAPTTAKKNYSVVYTGSSPALHVAINNQTKTLQPLIEVPVGEAGSLHITQNNQPVGDVGSDGPGNFLAILYDGPGSGLKVTLAEDIIYRQAGRR